MPLAYAKYGSCHKAKQYMKVLETHVDDTLQKVR